MRRILGVTVALACQLLFAQSEESPQLKKAREDLARVRRLVEAGALPRKAWDEAKMVFEEARDEAVLERTLYGPVTMDDVTETQAEEMIAAAESLVARQKKQLDQARRLVRQGAIPRLALPPYEEELDRRRRTLALARERADLFEELVEMVRRELELEKALATAPEEVPKIAARFDGNGVFLASQFTLIRLEFEREFGRPMPVSANGATTLHRSMGFDHRGRVDVALDPDSKEGAWLRALLEQMQIPYFAFRGAVAGKATGAHIHIGPPSPRIQPGN